MSAQPQTEMKAFVVEKYGKDGLRAAVVPRPEVGERDVLVKVSAASVNPLDKMVRNGEFKQLLRYKKPFVLGHDVAGVVAQVGRTVRGFKVGDEVYSRPRDLRIGTFAEYIAIDQDDVALKPASLTLHEAAALPLVALAAWQTLVDLAQVSAGQKVLVHAGAGGLGSTVVQLAKHLGAHVATTAHTNEDHFGVTVNDVVVAICAGALRTWLEDRGELPDEPLLAMIPLSVRTEAQRGTYGNRIATMLAPIPTDVGDPAERLAATHATLRSAKQRHKATPATVLQDANDAIPPAIFARAARVTTSVGARLPGQAPVNVIISNVPGSPQPLYLGGARLEALHPVSPIAHGTGLNITVMSHAGGLNYGIVADRDRVNDAWPLAAAIDDAHAELLRLCS